MQEDSSKQYIEPIAGEPQKETNEYLRELTKEKYKYGFTPEIHTDIIG